MRIIVLGLCTEMHGNVSIAGDMLDIAHMVVQSVLPVSCIGKNM